MVVLVRAADASKGWKVRTSYRPIEYLIAKFEHVLGLRYWLGLHNVQRTRSDNPKVEDALLLVFT